MATGSTSALQNWLLVWYRVIFFFFCLLFFFLQYNKQYEAHYTLCCNPVALLTPVLQVAAEAGGGVDFSLAAEGIWANHDAGKTESDC